MRQVRPGVGETGAVGAGVARYVGRMHEVRRSDDGELCGHVVAHDREWHALTVFGGLLGAHVSRGDAEQHVLDHGLASLADRWEYRRGPADEWQIVCIQEARPGWVRLALDYYSMPGVPTTVVTAADLAAGAALRRNQ